MKTNPTRALAVAAGLVIVALTGAAFWLSYAHLAEVALGHGLGGSPVRAWAWPACLDLFIMAGEIMWLRAALGHRVDPWAIGLTVIGSGGSIALNVAGVGSDAGLLEYTVAAVPPTAALLAFGALMRQVHQALAGHGQPNVDVIHIENDQEDVGVIHVSQAVEVERVPDAVPAVPEVYPEITAAVPEIPEAVPPGVRLLPTFDCPGELRRALRDEQPVPVLAAEPPRTRPEVHAEYVPEPMEAADPVSEGEESNPAQADPLNQLGLDWAAEQFKEELLAGKMPGIHRIKSVCKVGQDRAKEIQDGFRQAQVAWRLAGTGVSS